MRSWLVANIKCTSTHLSNTLCSTSDSNTRHGPVLSTEHRFSRDQGTDKQSCTPVFTGISQDASLATPLTILRYRVARNHNAPESVPIEVELVFGMLQWRKTPGYSHCGMANYQVTRELNPASTDWGKWMQTTSGDVLERKRVFWPVIYQVWGVQTRFWFSMSVFETPETVPRSILSTSPAASRVFCLIDE